MNRWESRLRVSLVVSLGLALSSGLFLGCNSEKRPSRSPAAAVNSDRTQLDHLRLLEGMLHGEQRLDSAAFARETVRLLNQWRLAAPGTVEWETDPLVAQWTGALGDEVAKNLASADYFEADARYLRQQAWSGALAQWLPSRQRVADYRLLIDSTLTGLDETQLAAIRQSPTPLADVLAIRYPNLNREQSQQLAAAWVGFDWTIRNVQQDELRDVPGENELSILALVDGRRDLPASMGVPGPGYTQFVDGVLAYGHGDGWQRGRVFLSIAYAMGLDAAWLAVRPSDQTPLGESTPWVVAVKIGDEAFLFDPILGLPIPTANQDGIATWNDVRNDPQLLSRLDVADFERASRSSRGLPYRVSADDLSRVVVLLDIDPAALTERMALLEESLTGSARVQISRFPSREAEQWSEMEGIQAVGLWDVPVLTAVYRRVYEAAVRNRNERVIVDYLFNEQSLEMAGLQTGRHLVMLGRLETAERFSGEVSAKEIFQSMRYTDAFISSLDTDDALRRQFGVDTEGALSVEERTQMTSILKQQLRSTRVVAVLWMGLLHYELGDAGNARQWLGQVEEFDWRESWGDAGRYNLARSFELQRRDEDAAKVYQQIGGPQESGNALRARWLFDRIRSSETTPAEPNVSESESESGSANSEEPSSTEPNSSEPNSSEPSNTEPDNTEPSDQAPSDGTQSDGTQSDPLAPEASSGERGSEANPTAAQDPVSESSGE